MDNQIPIVVVAYNRPKALERLLASLLKADYPGKVELIISVDGEMGRHGDGEKRGRGEEEKRGRGDEVRRVADEFVWPFGEKKLIFHETNLGLRNHVLSCGDLSRDYAGIIVLEDDLFVSPNFYRYTIQAYDFFKDDAKIAGISLYSHAYNETAQFPFVPLDDGSDVFFFQYASSWGQFWSREGWSRFREWYEHHRETKEVGLPPNIRLWPQNSWKKYFIRFIIQYDLYFVYPRKSLTTIFSDEGTNIRVRETFLQVPLGLEKGNYQFKAFGQSNAVYDIFCEMLPDRLKRLAPELAAYDFQVDLYGMKSIEVRGSEMFLSSRPCNKPVLTFGREMKPHEMNIVTAVQGNYFALGNKTGFEDKHYFTRLLKCHEKKELAYWYSIREYHFSGKKLLSTGRPSLYWLDPVFFMKKAIAMVKYSFQYFFKK